jgi:hypothetical protein
VIDQTDTQDPRGFVHALGQLPIGTAWRGVTTRMIVHKDNGRGGVEQRRPEDFPRMDKRFREAAKGHHVPMDNAILLVQRKNVKCLLRQALEIPACRMDIGRGMGGRALGILHHWYAHFDCAVHGPFLSSWGLKACHSRPRMDRGRTWGPAGG